MADVIDRPAHSAPQVGGKPYVAPRRGSAARRRKQTLQWVAVHSLAIAAALFFVLPVLFVFLTSVMSDQQALTGTLWPRSWHWGNYMEVWRTPGFLTWWRNSVTYAVLGTVLTVVSSLPVAYALAKLRFRGRNLSLTMVIAMMMLPPQVVIIPMYLFWAKQLHLSGTLWPLIIPMAFGDAYSIFLLRQFLLTIPTEYLDAARVDGCGEWRTLLKVVTPMARPGIAAAAIFQFFFAWNDYFGPYLYTSENQDNWTLSLGLASFRTVHAVAWNLVSAASVLTIAPVVVLFFFAQRAFVQGVTLTGVKG